VMLACSPTLVVVAFLFWVKGVGLEGSDQEWRERPGPPSSFSP
jgi:hypothetical protein